MHYNAVQCALSGRYIQFILKILIGRFDDAELERKKKLVINAFKECICEQLEYDDIYCCKLRDKNIYKRY